ncbi:MAG: cation-transporting P-type ATPase [Hyphomicrobiales bacterium]
MKPELTSRAQTPTAYALPVEAVLGQQSVDPASGLTDAEVAARLTRYGSNTLITHPPRTALSVLIDQFRSPVVWLLGAAAGSPPCSPNGPRPSRF